MKYCLKTENCCLETLTKHPPNHSKTQRPNRPNLRAVEEEEEFDNP